MDITWLISFLALGCFVGFTAGLLGIGGGGILVPILTFIFLRMGLATNNVIHIALGTSMACIIVTSLSSLLAHNKKGTVQWQTVKSMTVGVVLGSFIAAQIASYLSTLYLAIVFSAFMAWTALKMLSRKSHAIPTTALKNTNMFYPAFSIGGLSALVSIGGGSLIVPYLTNRNVDIKTAIGTSAAIGFPISVAGAIGYTLNTIETNGTMDHQVGFIYLPAVILISLASFLFAPLGASISHRLPTKVLKTIFACLLIILSLKMLSILL